MLKQMGSWQLKVVNALADRVWTPKQQKQKLLQLLADDISCKGPCSLIQATNFFSNGGSYKDSVHIQVRAIDIRPQVQWRQALKDGKSVVEKALARQARSITPGAARLGNLLTESEFVDSQMGRLAKRIKMRDSAYLWFRCDTEDLWVVCLRRREKENDFTDSEVQRLQAIALDLNDSLRRWYVPAIQKLTQAEVRVAKLVACGATDEQIQFELSISRHTVISHVKSIRHKLNLSRRSQIAGAVTNQKIFFD